LWRVFFLASRPVKGENLETADLILEFAQSIKGFPRARSDRRQAPAGASNPAT
jgi:hypothetical protein